MTKYDDLKQTIDYSSPFKRREKLIANMKRLIKSGKHCYDCQGFCCTYSNNSMRITPLQALDLYEFLSLNDRINEELVSELKRNIKDYRLDKEISLGRGRELRRYYTCPFFKPGAKGCSVDIEYKPYGCLAFNPLEENVTEEGHCTSDQSILAQREVDSTGEEILSHKIRESLKLDWDTKNISAALLDLIEKVRSKH